MEEDAPKSDWFPSSSGSSQIIRIGDKITTAKVAAATGIATPAKAMLQGLMNSYAERTFPSSGGGTGSSGDVYVATSLPGGPGITDFLDSSGIIPRFHDPKYIAAMEAHGRAIFAAQAKQRIQAYSTANRDSGTVVTVSEFLGNLQHMVDIKKDVRRSSTDTGCASFIDDGITNLPREVGHGGSTSIFFGSPSSRDPKTDMEKQLLKANAVIWGEIDSVGGVDGLVKGMVLGEWKDDTKIKVKHSGVYAGNGMVYSFSAANVYGSLRPYQPHEWDIYGWHEGVVLD